MPIPIVYRKSGEGSVASYDYSDIAEGTGVFHFYPWVGVDSNVLSSTNTHYSNDVVKHYDLNDTTTSTKILDVDFDVVFNLPKIIGGTAVVTLTLGYNMTTADGGFEQFARVRIRKDDGVNPEVEVATNDTALFAESDTGHLTQNAPYSETFSVEIDVPKTHYRKGDILRLTIEIWGKTDATKRSWMGFGCDPADQNDDYTDLTGKIIEDTDRTVLDFYVPFVLDL